MTAHIKRKCRFCGQEETNPVYVNWGDGPFDQTMLEAMNKWHNSYECNACSLSQ